MIQINLLQFGGRGGSGDSIGAGHNTDIGSGKKQDNGSGSGRKMDNIGQPQQPAAVASKSSSKGSTEKKKLPKFGNKVSSIKPDENYVLLSLRFQEERHPRGVKGSAILKSIKAEDIHYDKTREVWIHKNGGRYIIRKRK